LFMNDLLSPLSLRTDRPLEPWRVEILHALDAASRECKFPYMLVGATARDLLLYHVHGGPHPRRRTRDVDFGIAVDSWEEFERVRDALLAKGNFKPTRVKHRLIYSSAAVDEVEVDVIPFGGLASGEGTITWPPEFDTAMNVAGFQDALSAALWISIVDGLPVPVVSLPGLAILKLFAWADRRDDRDATDLYRVIQHYADAGNEDRLYDSPLAEEFGFDFELAGAKLLGSDVVALCQPTTLQKLAHLFTPGVMEKLGNQMMREGGYSFEEAGQRTAQLLDLFFGPLLEAAKKKAE
jgi:predicted nucleotidyltransferase